MLQRTKICSVFVSRSMSHIVIPCLPALRICSGPGGADGATGPMGRRVGRLAFDVRTHARCALLTVSPVK